MRSTINLHILQREFAQLSESAYFDKGFKEFNSKTLGAINHVLSNLNQYPPTIVKAFEAHLWNARTFVKGSRAGDTPYEVQYALKLAAKQWMNDSVLISNAELEEINFFLNILDLWEFIHTALTNFDSQNYKPIVVRIGAPSVYKNRPAFCIPLFHELGHFVDLRLKVTEVSMLIHQPSGIDPQDTLALQQVHRHRMEHFADLFSACYCGDSLNKALIYIAGMQAISSTHPATADRIKTVNEFLTGASNPIVDILQNTLTILGLPILSKKYVIPLVEPSFHDLLVHKLDTDEELFGLFPAAWTYLENQLDTKSAPWINNGYSDFNIESTINDLTQKSLRNYEITKRWSDVIGA